MQYFTRLHLAALALMLASGCDAPSARVPVATLPVKVVLSSPATGRSQQKMVDAISALGRPLELGAPSPVLIPRIDVVRIDSGSEIGFLCRPPRRVGVSEAVRNFWGKGSNAETLDKDWRAYVAGSDSLRTFLAAAAPESSDPLDLDEYVDAEESEIRYIVSSRATESETEYDDPLTVSTVDGVREAWAERLGELEDGEPIPTVAVIFGPEEARSSLASKDKQNERPPDPERRKPPVPIPDPTEEDVDDVAVEPDPEEQQETRQARSRARDVSDNDPSEDSRRPASTVRVVAVPVGEPIVAMLESTVSTRASEAGQIVVARVLESIEIDGCEVIPAGSQLRGQVTLSRRANKIGGKAKLAVEFIQVVTVDGQRATLLVEPLILEGESTLGGDLGRVAAGALVGATVGESTGKKKAAEKGAAIGTVLGVVSAVTSSGNDIDLPPGTRLDLVTMRPVSLRATCAS